MAIIRDLETSSLEELNIWAKRLDLPEGSNKNSLISSIAKYYNVDLLGSSSKTNKNDKTININRAELSKYYTIEEVDESFAEFEGRVEIVIDDVEQKIQHSIIGDKINFNRTLNSVTALGNVQYIKTEKGKPELVTAESLTFNLTNWKGSMVKCISKQDKTIDEESMVFYYVTGEIKKSDTEIMGMNDVTIQTVSGSPYFNISAKDLWMLDSSDFVIISPWVKVGHVPVFWFPFYYHSENNLYFNPVYGVRSREGTFLQNTLYLLGAKPVDKEQSDFSFLSFDNGEGVSNKEFNGLTLVPSKDKSKYSSDYSKIMLDYYSNLGIFIGSDTNLNFSGTKIDLETGLGFSRSINDSTGLVFVNKESIWNHSYMYGNEVPFRYNFNLDLTFPFGSLNIISLSDPYFKSDFYNRKENFKWVDYFTDQLDQGLESFSSGAALDYRRDTSEISLVSEYSWSLDFKSYSPNVSKLNPYIDKFTFDIKKIELDFNSKITKGVTLDALGNQQLEVLYEDYDPSYKFFYPEVGKVPILLNIQGRLFDTSFSKKDIEKVEDNYNYIFDKYNNLLDLENPTVVKTEDKESSLEHGEVESKPIYNFEYSEIFGDEKIASKKSNPVINTKFKYNVNIPLSLYLYWDNTLWNNPVDIDYSLSQDSMLYNTDPYIKGDYTLDVLDSFIKISNTTKGNIYLKKYIEEDDQADLISLYKWNKSIVENDLKSTIDFLKLFPEIEKHSLSLTYKLNSMLYKKSFDQDAFDLLVEDDPVYKIENFKWTKDYIDDNELYFKYTYKVDFSETSLGYKKILPPLEEERSVIFEQKFDIDLLADLNNISTTTVDVNKSITQEEVIDTLSVDQVNKLKYKSLEFSTKFGSEFDGTVEYIFDNKDNWDFDPLGFELKYKPTKFFELSLSSDFDLNSTTWESYYGKIKLWDIDFTLTSSYNNPVKWNEETLRWDTLSDLDKVLSPESLTIKHNFDLKKFKFWKNRVTLNIDSNLSFKKEFIKVDTSFLNYKLVFGLDIYEFLELNFTSSSSNNSIFQYIEGDSDILGLNSNKNILIDLIKSFNFFNREDRVESNFNLNSMKVDAIYKMPDWNLIFSYTGEPKLEDSNINWFQKFSFFIEWKPLSLVRSDVVNDDDNWSVSTSGKED